MSTTDITTARIETDAEAFAERLVESVAGAFETYAVYLGDHLGYYAVLAAAADDGAAGKGSLTPGELAARAGTNERYTREWCEQQAITGVLAVDDAGAPPAERRYHLPTAHAEALLDEDSEAYVGPLAQTFVGAAAAIRDVAEAYRTGGGVDFEVFGPDMREGQGRMNRPLFLHDLGEEWLPSLPDVDAALREEGARIADVGCGVGWSAIGMARAYPAAHVDGFDLDEPSVREARGHVREAGLTDRVEVHHRDAADPAIPGDYDLVTAFECVHDMSDPVGALRTMRRLAGDDGTVLVMDERAGESFDAPAEFDWMFYGWSVLHCLPAGMAHQPSAATGTVMRTDTLRAYADDAGFTGCEVLPIETPFFRFYRLTP